MKLKKTFVIITILLMLAVPILAQDTGASGFIISLKNGSSVRGRTLSRDDATGKLRLAMTEDASGEAKSYAVIAPEDTTEIRSSASDSDSIRIKLKGGSDLRCKEFSLNGDSVAVKLGSASKVEVRWSDIESISFAQ
ncbi:MAG TPA: hypothetical protein VN687_03875 [Blastocatellia bacterium]|nr:hypothetical protein [Blastocatellia bacterium]